MLIARRHSRLFLCISLSALASCGGSSESTAPPPPQKVATSVAFTAGDGQTVRKGTPLPITPTAIVKDQNGAPMEGVTVTFSITGGGSLTTTSVTTGSDGLASVGGWVLGPAVGANVLTATASGALSPFARLTATARNPLWTFMVYMAADNSLALAGIYNLDQMEAAGSNPEVQVVVQAEFGATALQQSGCTSACFNRPNFDTFRYIITGQGTPSPGPNGPVVDLGNRNMTDPAQLSEFISWTKQNAPAEHYAVVLWNHGGGYRGLIEDVASAPGTLMSLTGLSTALSGAGAIDILAFDMCLMGSYETLTKVNGYASFAVFSENEVPGNGYPYDAILHGLQANPGMTSRNAAIMFADQFHASYQGSRSTTTVSAYDLAGFTGFESSLNTLALSLKANMSGLGGGITAAAQGSQAFEFVQLKDLGNFLDSLRVQVSDATVRSNIDAVKSSATAFRLQQHARTGSGSGVLNVDKATGLSIVMPSGVGYDQLPSSGTGSLAAYQSLEGNRPWAQFISAWVSGQSGVGYTDLGANQFEAWLVWDSAEVSQKGDVDLWILEPDGNVYSPAFGTVSANGDFSADSYPTTYLEGYQMHRFVQTGTYAFYAFLWVDPNNYGPAYTLAYRNSPADPFQYLYNAPFPRLTTATSIQNDPAPTFAKIDGNQYTDIRQVATLTIAPNPPPSPMQSPGVGMSSNLIRPRMTLSSGIPIGQSSRLSSAQVRTIRALLKQPRVRHAQSRLVPRAKLNFVLPGVSK